MNLTIFGASGGVGRELVAQAVARGHRVRAVLRRPAPVPCGAKPVLVDDVTDPARVTEVTRGADAVLGALGLRRRSPRNPWSPLASPPDLCARWARAMVGGCGPRCRAIVVSAAGVGDGRSRMNAGLRWLFDRSNVGVAYRDLEAMERVFRGSMIDWTAVCPATFVDARPTTAAEPTREIDFFGLSSRIARAEVARYMIDLAEGRRVASTRTPMIARG